MRDGSGAPSVRSVYVHAPFCARRCTYCDFAVKVSPRAGPGEWLEALAGELEAIRAEGVFRIQEPLETLYVGGGTPSLLGPDAMAGVAALLGAGALAASDLEWTAEANPESFNDAVARGWRAAGVTRLSLGVQSFHGEALRWMGRLHGPEGARSAVRSARRQGLEDLSLDLIFGLPERLGRSWTRDLEQALDLEPPHLSLYGLTVESGTPLGRAVAEGRERVAGDERYREEYLEAADRLTRAGYVHYEVSSFALPGHESRHNRAYWSGRPYVGLGNGAHSYFPGRRRWNLRDWDAYSRTARTRRLAVESEERLSPEARRLEAVWLGLRTRAGLDPAGFPPEARQQVGRWVRAGLAEEEPGSLRLTAEGWLILDGLAVELEGSLPPPA